MSQFDQEIWQNFVLEVEGNLQELESNLLLSGQGSSNASLLNKCFRNMQRIKDAAGYMGLEQTATLAHNMENLFDKVRQGSLVFTEDVINLIFLEVDRLRKLVQEAAEKNTESNNVSDNVEDLDAILFNSRSNKVDSEAREATLSHDPGSQDRQIRNAKKAMEGAVSTLFPKEPAEGNEFTEVLEEDGEIYKIFLDFAKEISGPLANVPDWPEEEWLSASQDTIKKLRASANYMDYGEVVAVLDEWDERLVEALSTSYDSSSFNPGPLRQIWLRLVDLLPGLVPDDKMAKTGKS
ncbi:MAG: Hpt domain-containing protein [Deltaproteobacteria bacterium]|nr:Hpt domain-containing protein [Deltaproteobacteria bacterium]MDL1960711.1 Hpt domain-containing protein [Deltaproteobacteria bacterium]